VPLSWRKRSASQKGRSDGKLERDRYRQSTGKHHRSQKKKKKTEVKKFRGVDQERTREPSRVQSQRRDPRLDHPQDAKRLRKWIVALKPSPNETVKATMLANCRPCPVALKIAPEATMGNPRARMAENITARERNAAPIKTATKPELERQAATQFSIIVALFRAAITERPVTDML